MYVVVVVVVVVADADAVCDSLLAFVGHATLDYARFRLSRKICNNLSNARVYTPSFLIIETNTYINHISYGSKLKAI